MVQYLLLDRTFPIVSKTIFSNNLLLKLKYRTQHEPCRTHSVTVWKFNVDSYDFRTITTTVQMSQTCATCRKTSTIKVFYYLWQFSLIKPRWNIHATTSKVKCNGKIRGLVMWSSALKIRFGIYVLFTHKTNPISPLNTSL